MVKKTRKEALQVALTLALIAIGVRFFLPNQPIDPWGIFNPQRFGLIIVILSGMQFCGFIAIHIFGAKLGVLFMGFFGGLVSSTAVFATLPQFLKGHSTRLFPGIAAAILSVLAMLLELSVIVILAAPDLFKSISLIILSMFIVGLISVVLIYRRDDHSLSFHEPAYPLDLKSIVYLSTVIAVMIFIIAIIQHFFGARAVEIASFLGGFFELHSVTLGVANLFSIDKLDQIHAQYALLLALLSSFITKLILLWWVGRNHFAAITSLILLLMIASGIITTLIQFSFQ